jgi:hypothetical protein
LNRVRLTIRDELCVTAAVAFNTAKEYDMRYIAVKWHHNSPDNPVELLSELDESDWEQRKVEIFADGRRDYADHREHSGTTKLGECPVPPLSEIGADPQFSPREISRDEFENVWKTAKGQ